MATVYFVQEPLKRDRGGNIVSRFNLGTAERYGRIVYLFSWGELKDGTILTDTPALLARLREKLAEYSDRDWIVPAGNPALIALATLVAADMNEGRVQILDWIRDDGCYREVTIDMEWEPLRISGDPGPIVVQRPHS